MKSRLLFAFYFAACFSPLAAQFNWQHTEGPNGGSQWNIWNNDQFAFYADEYFLYRTSDGINWEKFPENAIYPLGMRDSTLVGQFYQGNSFGYNQPSVLKISHNNGELWTQIDKPPVSYIQYIVVCDHGIYIPEGEKGIIHYSDDEGLTWDTMMPPFQYGYDLWAFDDRLYTLINSELYRTDANGQNWTSVTLPFAAGNSNLFVHGQHIIIATSSKLWHSHDDGQTWDFHDTPWPNYFNEFTLVGNEVFVAGYNAGLAKSADFGVTWQELSSAPFYPPINDIVTAGGKALVLSYDQGVFHWDESAHTLKPSSYGLGSAGVSVLASDGNKVWAGAGNGIFAYDQQQKTWTQDSPLPLLNHGYDILSAQEGGVICATPKLRDYFYLSQNGGTSWDTIYPNLSQGPGLPIEWIKVLDSVVFIRNYLSFELWRWADLGFSWQPLSTPIWDVIKFKNKYLGFDFQNNIYASTDQGLTWTYFADFPPGNFGKVYVMGDRLLAAGYIQVSNQWKLRVYASEDGITWKYAHDGLPDAWFAGLDPETYQYADFFEYAGKYYVYQSDLGFYASLDSCKTWVPVESSPYRKFVLLADSVFYSAGPGGGVLRAGIPDVYGALASGTVYRDDNNNGVRDGGESAIPNIRVGLDAPDAWYPFYLTTTDASGAYALGVSPGADDTLQPIFQSGFVENINPPYRLVGNGGDHLDFGVKLTPGINDLSVAGHSAGRPRPGRDLGLYLQYANAGTTEPTDAVLSVKLDNHLAYLGATPPPTAVFGDSLVWSLGSLAVFNGGNVKINTHLPAATPLGLGLASICRIKTSIADLKPDDNLRIIRDTVVGSYDPNEKRAEPADGLTAAEIMAGKDIFYTVQFQNTGTFPAERVRITDLIDTALYLPSCRFVAASHPVSGFRLNPGGLLEVIFDPILLPDSNSNEAASHGFVTFAVQRKKAFDPAYVVRNDAAIYFDFNEPILTNEVSTPLKTTSVSLNEPTEKEATQEIKLLIYPNPAPDVCTISTEGRLSGPGVLVVQNTSGQVLQQHKVADMGIPVTVQTTRLPDGIYFVRLSGDAGFLAGRMVVTQNR